MMLHAAVTADAPESRVLPSSGRQRTLSERLWGIDWSSVLPWAFDGASVEQGTSEEALAFVAKHYGAIFGAAQDRFFVEPTTEAKRRFFEEQDVFLFRSEGEIVGIATAHPTDWSTYYFRWIAILPEYRERRWASDFAQRVCQPLRDVGCERWEAECSPANSAIIKTFLSQGCLVTASANTDRWGQMLRFTKFLGDAEKVYRQQFISVPSFGRQPQSK